MSGKNIAGGIAHGLAGLFGLGNLYDPMGELRGELSSSVAKLNNMTASESIAAVEGISSEIKTMYNTLELDKTVSDTMNKLNNDLIWNSIKQENLFLGVLSSVIIIIVFYLLIQKKCC